MKYLSDSINSQFAALLFSPNILAGKSLLEAGILSVANCDRKGKGRQKRKNIHSIKGQGALPLSFLWTT
jgi:hypothetical protein